MTAGSPHLRGAAPLNPHASGTATLRPMRTTLLTVAAGLALLIAAVHAQNLPPGQYDEGHVPAYVLPDPLLAADGTRDLEPRRLEHAAPARAPGAVRARGLRRDARRTAAGTVRTWPKPNPDDRPRWDCDKAAGHADVQRRRRRLSAESARRSARSGSSSPPPSSSPSISTATTPSVRTRPSSCRRRGWTRAPGVVKHQATEASRGTNAAAWPLARIAARGYSRRDRVLRRLRPGFRRWIPEWCASAVLRARTDEARARRSGARSAPGPGGLSRMLDYVATRPDLDAHRAVVLGHSRLGKAALWAAAQDERFAMAVSNESGCGGAALSKRIFGETVRDINERFPHWFAASFRKLQRPRSGAARRSARAARADRASAALRRQRGRRLVGRSEGRVPRRPSRRTGLPPARSTWPRGRDAAAERHAGR